MALYRSAWQAAWTSEEDAAAYGCAVADLTHGLTDRFLLSPTCEGSAPTPEL